MHWTEDEDVFRDPGYQTRISGDKIYLAYLKGQNNGNQDTGTFYNLQKCSWKLLLEHEVRSFERVQLVVQ